MNKNNIIERRQTAHKKDKINIKKSVHEARNFPCEHIFLELNLDYV